MVGCLSIAGCDGRWMAHASAKNDPGTKESDRGVPLNRLSTDDRAARKDERKWQAEKIREIVGNCPFEN